MGTLQDFLAGRQILEKANSAVNGKLTVVRELAWGIHIMAGGITQSGGIAADIWKTTFRRLGQKDIKKVLIVGFGGGGIAKLVAKNWPQAKIIGVEIDPVIVELGRKYLGIDNLKATINIADGLDFCQKLVSDKKTFDLICIDTYIGQKFPAKFTSGVFLSTIKKLLSKKGMAIFNRLYYKEKIVQAHKFQAKLEKTFREIEVVKPEANIMFLCSNEK